MAEMPDVVTLTTISSDWGNDIRDRTVQRYSSVANRTTEHSSPVEGDLSYLEDTNTVWVYNGSAWVTVYPADPTLFEVDGYTEVSSVNLTGTLANVATVNLTIPTSWGSWKCDATATFKATNIFAGTSIYHYRLTIDGTALQTVVTSRVGEGYDDSGAVVGRRTGMTTTGSRTIALQANDTTGEVTFNGIALYARAVRLT